MSRKKKQNKHKAKPAVISQQASPAPGASITDFSTTYDEARRLMREKQYGEASTLVLNVIKVAPEEYQALELMALIAERIHNYDSCMTMFKEMKKIFPENFHLDVYIGHMLIKLNRQDESIPHLESALKADPKFFRTNYLLGVAYLMMGQKEEMKHFLEKAYEIHPTRIECLYNYLTHYKKIESRKDKYFKSLLDAQKEIEADPNLDVKYFLLLYYALFKAYDDLKDYDEAFKYLEKASKLKRANINYFHENTVALFDQAKSYFDKEYFENIETIEGREESSKPVFILGMPRSGTTLLEQILHAHPDVEGIGEDPLLAFYVKNYSYLEPHNKRVYPLRIEYGGGKQFLRPDQIAEKYLNYLNDKAPDALRVVNKSINNIVWVGYIAQMYPNAKLIFLQRNAVDSCLSMFTKNFNEDLQGFTYDMDELADYYRANMELMAHWQDMMGDRIFSIAYEDIVNDTEGSARAILKYLDLPWNEQCLEFYNAKRLVQTASVSQVRKPIYKSAQNRWRKYDKHLLPLIEALGQYAPQDAQDYLHEQKSP